MSEPGVIDPTPDSVWEATLATLGLQHPAVQDCVYRLAVVHWFDDRLAAALKGASPPIPLVNGDDSGVLPVDLMMAVVESQPFVEPEDDNRFRLHAQVRQHMLNRLMELDPGFLAANESAAIEELLRRNEENDGLDDAELIEFAYLLLARDAQPSLADQVFAGKSKASTIAVLDRLLTYVKELDLAGRLPDDVADRAKLWGVWVASASADYKLVVRLGQSALEQMAPESELGDDVAFQVAIGLSQIGSLSDSRRLFADIAERHHDDELGLLARIYGGDIAPSPLEAEQAYLDAVRALISIHAPGWDPDFDWRDPLMWALGTFQAEVDASSSLVVAVGPESDLTVMPADINFAELWLRLGQGEGRRGKLATATGWLGLAEHLFEALGDADGLQRAWELQRTLLSKYGGSADIRALEETFQARLDWARVMGAAGLEMQALVDLASARWNSNDLDGADEYFATASTVALRIEDDYAAASIAESRATIASQQQRHEDAGRQLADAELRYLMADPDSAHQLELTKASMALDRRDPEGAQSAYRRLLDWAVTEKHPDDEVRARLGLARVAEEQFDLVGADEQLVSALSLGADVDPMLEIDILMQRGHVLRLMGRDAEAMELDRQLERRAEEFSRTTTIAWLLDERAATASRRGDSETATQLHREALRIFEEADDRDGIFYSLLGLSWAAAEMNKHDEALAAAERATQVAQDSRLPALMNAAIDNLGNALVSAGRYEEAIETLLEALQLDEQSDRLRIALSWACLRAGRFDDSVGWSREALRITPSNSYAYRNLGHALLCLGEVEEAFAAYRQAIAGRFGDEHFRNTLDELDFIARTFPATRDLIRARELFEHAQAELDHGASK